MKILLYDYFKLEERVANSLKVWKACHILIYVLIAICGLLNFIFLLNTREMVDDHCVLYPRNLTFRMFELTNLTSEELANDAHWNETAQVEDVGSAQDSANGFDGGIGKPERDLVSESLNDPKAVTLVVNNVTIIIANTTHRLMLDPSRSLFQSDYECQFAEFMPIVSSIFALVWITMFVMCPRGGRATSGLQQPWRVVVPALVFAFVLAVLTGLGFGQTNGGVRAFCEAFADYTNSTTCSSTDQFIERSRNATWGFGARAAALRAACAGVWAGWACAAALLLARCLAAPDFALHRTAIHLVKDPQQKIIPYLRKSPSRRSPRSSAPSAPDTASMRSDPTASTQLVTASIHGLGHDSAPPTPEGTRDLRDVLEMTETPARRE